MRAYLFERTNSLLIISEIYTSFSDITKASLKHALAESSCRLSDSEVANLLKAYDSLSTFPDVVPALKSLSSIPDLEAYIFSNGTQNMVSSSVKNSPDLSPHSDIFKSLVTIESAGAFKPSPKVYGYLAERIGMKGEEGNIWLVSGNPFDVVGAIKSGLKAAWVDRPCGHHNEGIWKDQLGLLCGIEGPTFIAKGVDEAVKKIGEYMDRNK